MLPPAFALTIFAFAFPEAVINSIQNEIARVDGPGGYYDKAYRKEESRYWVKLPEWIQADASKRKANRVLDIGCGYGTLLAFAAESYGAAGYCMDVTEYLRPAFARPRRLEFAKGNIELDPIPWTGKFDVVLLTEVLEHFNFQPAPTLSKIRDALAPGGLLFLTTPDASEWGRETKYYRKLSDLPPADRSKPVVDAHVWVYSKPELTSLLQKAGFKILKLDYAPGVGHRHFNIIATVDGH